MGLFGKLFGGKPEDLEDKAERQFADGDFGGAKLSFEKALDRSDGSARERIAARIDDCCDELALERIDEARRLLKQGDEDLAREELEGAFAVVASADVRAEAQEILDELEGAEASEAATDVEVTDEEVLLAVSGSWELSQAAEYELYGEAFTDAILLVHTGKAEEARPALEALVEEHAEDACYLWLEVGRVRLLCDDLAGGRDALIEFIDALPEDEKNDPLLAAFVELARIADEEGHFDEAMEFFEEAIETFEDDHRPYFAMGHFLLEHDLPAEAVDVLEAGSLFLDEIRPDWRMIQELGLAYAAAERSDEAIAQLERVVSFMTDRKILDFPPSTVLPLAKLHEEAGALDRAADLFAALTRGSDRKNHAHYHAEAGRLLAALGLDDEARRMLKRGLAVVADDDELRATLEARLADLEG